MDAAFTTAVNQFSNNPAIHGKALREQLRANPDQFFQNAIPLLKSMEEEAGSTYVQVLLLSHGLVLSHLLSDDAFSVAEVSAIAGKLSKVDPHFVVKSLQHVLPDPGQTAATEPAAVRLRLALMEVLQSVPEGPRLLLVMMRFFRDPDPRVRSKAALLVGKANQSARWVEGCMDTADSRVRANSVESLWDVDSDQVRTLLWNVLTDPDNRAVGNALYGLYRLGEVAVLEQILLMVQDKRDLFRSTAAWVMGRTGDQRFHPTLVAMIRDTPLVRTTAFRALGLLKQAKTRLEGLPPLQVSGWRNVGSQDQEEILVTVSREQTTENPTETQIQCIPGLRPTEFIVYRDEAIMMDYEVREGTRVGTLSMVFLLPFCGGEAHASHVQALQAAALHRRKADGWLIAKYSTGGAGYSTGGAESPGQPAGSGNFSFLIDSAQLDMAIRTQPDPAGLPAPLQCLQAIARASQGIRSPQIVLLATSTQDAFEPEFVAEANRMAYNLKASFHVVSVGAAEADPVVIALCQNSGGLYLQATESQLPQILSDLSLALIGSYRLRLASAPGTLRLQVSSEQGCGSVQIN